MGNGQAIATLCHSRHNSVAVALSADNAAALATVVLGGVSVWRMGSLPTRGRRRVRNNADHMMLQAHLRQPHTLPCYPERHNTAFHAQYGRAHGGQRSGQALCVRRAHAGCDTLSRRQHSPLQTSSSASLH